MDAYNEGRKDAARIMDSENITKNVDSCTVEECSNLDYYKAHLAAYHCGDLAFELNDYEHKYEWRTREYVEYHCGIWDECIDRFGLDAERVDAKPNVALIPMYEPYQNEYSYV